MVDLERRATLKIPIRDASPSDRLNFTQDIGKQAGNQKAPARKRHDRPLSNSALGRSKNAPVCQILPKGFNKAEYYKKLIDQMLRTNASIDELEQVYAECHKTDCVPNNDLRRVLKKIMKLKHRQRMEIELEQRKRALSADRQKKEGQPTSAARPDSRGFRPKADSHLSLPSAKPRRSLEHERYDETAKTIKLDTNDAPHVAIKAESSHPQVLITPSADTASSAELLLHKTTPNPHDAMDSTIKDPPAPSQSVKKAGAMLRSSFQTGELNQVINAQASGGQDGITAPQKASVLLKRGLLSGELAKILDDQSQNPAKEPSQSVKKAAAMLRSAFQSGELNQVINAQLNGGKDGITAPQKAAVLLKRGLVSGKLAKILDAK